VGETDFDLAKFGKSFQITERLPLSGPDPSAFIEVFVKTTPLDPAPSTPSVTNHFANQSGLLKREASSMIMYERKSSSAHDSNEGDLQPLKEEFEEKEKQFKQRTLKLKKDITDAKLKLLDIQ